MFSYFAYGLGIESDLFLPEFTEAKVGCDITLYVNKNITPRDYLPEDIFEHPWGLKVNRQDAMVYVKDTGVFLIEDGQKIVVIPEPNTPESALRYYIVGTVMAIVLYQRGLLVLHASVVNIDGGAVSFLGVSGQGKSSTAAAFYREGYDILTDDVAPVTLGQGLPTITPGFPQIKLGREIAAVLGHNFDTLVSLHPSEKKRGYRLTKNFPKTPLPIRCIYVIADDTEFTIEHLTPQEAVMELVRHSRPTTLFHSGGAEHFLQCASLAKECNVYRLKRPRNLSLLPKLVQLVEEHVVIDTDKLGYYKNFDSNKFPVHVKFDCNKY